MTRDAWRAAPLVSEAIRNVVSVRARLFPVLVLAVLTGSSIAAVSAFETTVLRDQLATLQLDGRLVVEISSEQPQFPARIGRASCESLSGQPGIARAGLVVPEGFADIGQLAPGTPVTAASSTLFPELDRSDALIGSALRAPGPDFFLAMPAGNVTLAHVMPAQPRGIDTNSAVVVPLQPADVTGPSCRVVFDPYSDPQEVIARAVAQLRSSGSVPISANSAFQDNISPVGAYLGRVSRFLPLVLGVLGGFASAVIDRVRLSEFAAYRLSGTSGRSLALLLVLEQLTLAGCLAAAGGLSAVALCGYAISVTAVVLSSITAAAAWVLTACIFTADIPARRPTTLAKDR